MTSEWPKQAQQAGLSQPIVRQIATLSELLAEVAEQTGRSETIALFEEFRSLCAAGSPHGDYSAATAKIQGLTASQIEALLRMGLTWFQLLNAAEKQEISRINRERRSPGEREPPSESIDEAVRQLKEAGCSLEEAEDCLRRLDIRPTLTAHPTESSRRAVLIRLQRIGEQLAALQRADMTEGERLTAREALRKEISLLLLTEPMRSQRPEVEEEVEHGITYLVGTIWNSVPELARLVEQALSRHYGAIREPPGFLRFCSWIGGDRDGNPNVTPAVTRWTFDAHRQAAIKRHLTELGTLADELSVSERQAPASSALRTSIAADLERVSLEQRTQARFADAPYQLKIACMKERLSAILGNPAAEGAAPYRAADYVRDLELMRDSLVESGLGPIARRGHIARALILARTFGFHLAALDIRQHSAVHEKAVAAILRAAGKADDYRALPETERLTVLEQALQEPQPLLHDTQWPEAAQDILEVLSLAQSARDREPDAIGAYVISMTHAVSDALEVLLLARESGLWQQGGDRGHAPIDVVPLFETVDDLSEAGERLAALFAQPAWRTQLAGRGSFQEIMIGYSDSNKDGGFWMTNRLLHGAQEDIARVCREQGVAFRLFHGRGGSVERGGGLANQTILASAPAYHNGRLRFTEQGEVISFRYGSVLLAARHLEQIMHALLVATGCSEGDKQPSNEAEEEKFRKLGQHAMTAYRSLIEDEEFWPWYLEATPVRHIGRLPLASRPVARTGEEQNLEFNSLRAIPWVFAWSQTRYAVPGWFGLGSAVETGGFEPDLLRQLYRSSPFFQLTVANAERELARARLPIAKLYAGLADASRARIGQIIERDFEATRGAVFTMTEQSELLTGEPVLQRVIAFRQSFADVLHVAQVELLRRWQTSPVADRNNLEALLPLSITALAAAMESTG